MTSNTEIKKFAVAVKSDGALEVQIVRAASIYGAIWGHTAIHKVNGNELRIGRFKREKYTVDQIKHDFSKSGIDIDLVILWDEDFR